MELTPRETDSIHAILFEIRKKARSKRIPINSIENLCDRATLILKKASRRRTGKTKLIFTPEDFEI